MQGSCNSIADLLVRSSEHSMREAIVTSNERLTYTDLSARIERLGAQLVDLGIQPLEKVAWAERVPSRFVEVLYSVALAGAVGVPLNANSPAEEWYTQCSLCDVKMLLVAPELASKAIEVFGKYPGLRTVAILKGEEGHVVIHRLAERRVLSDPGDSLPGDAVILCTSGTTGQPKGVVLTHSSLAANQKSVVEYMKITEQDCMLVVKPLFHSSTLIELLSILHSGGRLILGQWFAVRGLLAQIKRERCSIMCLVPTMVRELLADLKLRPDISLPLRAVSVSGAPIAGRTLLELAERLPNGGVFHAYGLTEASPRVAALLPHELSMHPDSVGRPIPNVEVSVVGDDDEVLSSGSVGELVVRGPNVMRAYYRNANATAHALRDSYLHTGDLAVLDPQGYIYLRGRRDDQINCGGQKVYPNEVEQVLLEHPAIAEVFVQGMPDDRLGQVPIAWIVPASGHTPEYSDLRCFCLEHLAAYKVPRQMHWCTSLPHTHTGKLKRTLLTHHERSFEDSQRSD